MTRREPDAALRRFERDGLVAWGAMICLALVVTGGRLDVAVGVLAGGALTASSYFVIKGGVTALSESAGSLAGILRTAHGGDVVAPAAQAAATEGGNVNEEVAQGQEDVRSRGRRPLLNTLFMLVKFFTRYALLAVGAYVMLTCLELHPAGLLLGASTPFLAAVGQLVHLSRAPSGGKHLV
jgi:hypothetical protein